MTGLIAFENKVAQTVRCVYAEIAHNGKLHTIGRKFLQNLTGHSVFQIEKVGSNGRCRNDDPVEVLVIQIAHQIQSIRGLFNDRVIRNNFCYSCLVDEMCFYFHLLLCSCAIMHRCKVQCFHAFASVLFANYLSQMRKVVLDLAVTLDGFIEGPNGEIDWCIMDDDMNFDVFLSGIDTIFYGRVSYDTWGHFEPGDDASEAERSLWKAVHSKQKFVFSKQARAEAKDVFIQDDIVGKVTALKAQEGKDIWLYGGAGLIRTFIDLGLIDVYRISVHPVALGNGKPLFENLKERIALTLLKTNVFRSGVVQLIYEPQR